MEEDRAKFRLTRFDGQIRVEFELIGHRMNWLMMSQAFLFAAFATAAHSVASQTWTTAPNVSLAPPAERLSIPLSLLWILPVLGASSSFAAIISTEAARNVIDSMKDLRDKLEEQLHALGYEKLGVRRSDLRHRLGNLPSQILPWLFLFAWLFLLYIRFSTLSSRLKV